MKKTIILFSLLLVYPCISFAATGDILFHANFEAPGNTAKEVWVNSGGANNFGPLGLSSGQIVSGNGHDGGKSIKFHYPNRGELFDPFWTPVFNKPEITYTYWERFSIDPKRSPHWNIKSSRAFLGAGYMGGFISAENDGKWMQTFKVPATLTTTSKVTYVVTDELQSGYVYPSTTNVYKAYDGRVQFSWQPGFGTQWRKIRVYLKAPTSSYAKDGITKVWIDEELLYTLSDIPRNSDWGPNITNISFHPSDDFLGSQSFEFDHYYDDITVYEGYVPPKGQIISPPTGLRFITN